jgi:hypothetical protein
MPFIFLRLQVSEGRGQISEDRGQRGKVKGWEAWKLGGWKATPRIFGHPYGTTPPLAFDF